MTPTLAVCDDCGCGPTLTIAYEDGAPVAVLRCECAFTAAVANLEIDSLPNAWK